jgi:hypothetical protein
MVPFRLGKPIRALGILITLAATVFAIWLQITLGDVAEGGVAYFRLTSVIESLTPFGIGLLVTATGHALVLYETRLRAPVPPPWLTDTPPDPSGEVGTVV